MEFEILKITDNDDGSCDLDVKMSRETMLFLVNYAVVDILRRSLNELEKEIHATGT